MQPQRELVQIGCYLRQDQAEERGLVVLALQRPYWILEDGGLYCLYVDARDAAEATAELEIFEAERQAQREMEREARDAEPLAGAIPAPSPFSLYLFTWTMLLFYALQVLQGAAWMRLGEADSRAILHGELWRTVTALTLHADPGHLFANVATGLVFAWSLLPLLGSGWTWMGLVLSGAAGNLLNAVSHRGGEHHSIGASTAVFGGLGLLVGYQVVAALLRLSQKRPGTPWRWREVLLPLAAGLALLAYLGVGDGRGTVDILAHGFGMAAGLGIGAALAGAKLPERTTPRVQKALAAGALLLPALAWAWALL